MNYNIDDFEPVEEVVPQRNALQKGLRYGSQLASEALKGVFHLPEAGANLVKSILPQPSKRLPEYMQKDLLRPTKAIDEITELAGGKYEPLAEKGTHGEKLEKAGLYSAQALPYILSGGGSLPAKLVADFGGSVAKAYTENLTGNKYIDPVVSTLSDILVSHKLDKSADSLKKIVSGSNKIDKGSKIEKHISKIYDKSDSLGKELPAGSFVTNPIKNNLKKLEKLISEEAISDVFDAASSKRIFKNLEKYQDLLYKDNLNFYDLTQAEKTLNKHLKKMFEKKPQGSIEIDYFKDIKNIFTKGLEDFAENGFYPEWGKYYKNSKSLYQTSKWQSNLGEWAEEASKKGLMEKLIPNHKAQGILGGLLYYGLGSKAGLGIPLAAPIVKAGAVKGAAGLDKLAQGSKFAYHLTKTPEGLELLKDIIVDSAKNNIPKLTKNLRKLNDMADNYNESDFEEFSSEEWEPA